MIVALSGCMGREADLAGAGAGAGAGFASGSLPISFSRLSEDLCCNFLRIFAGNGRGHRFRPVGLPIIGTFVGWFGLRGGRTPSSDPGS